MVTHHVVRVWSGPWTDLCMTVIRGFVCRTYSLLLKSREESNSSTMVRADDSYYLQGVQSIDLDHELTKYVQIMPPSCLLFYTQCTSDFGSLTDCYVVSFGLKNDMVSWEHSVIWMFKASDLAPSLRGVLLILRTIDLQRRSFCAPRWLIRHCWHLCESVLLRMNQLHLIRTRVAHRIVFYQNPSLRGWIGQEDLQLHSRTSTFSAFHSFTCEFLSICLE